MSVRHFYFPPSFCVGCVCVIAAFQMLVPEDTEASKEALGVANTEEKNTNNNNCVISMHYLEYSDYNCFSQ